MTRALPTGKMQSPNLEYGVEMKVPFGQYPDASLAPTMRELSSIELETTVTALSELLIDSVNSGAGLGFLPPLSRAQGRDYWLSIRSELRNGSRLLFAAFAGARIVGTGQLVLSMWPNMPHKAELQKLLVSEAVRGRGIGRSLIAKLHDAARQRGRSLLTLSTRRGGGAETLYKSLGYRELGVMPRSTVGPRGELYDSVFLYQDLAERDWNGTAGGNTDGLEPTGALISGGNETPERRSIVDSRRNEEDTTAVA
jgi:acetyltransferase